MIPERWETAYWAMKTQPRALFEIPMQITEELGVAEAEIERLLAKAKEILDIPSPYDDKAYWMEYSGRLWAKVKMLEFKLEEQTETLQSINRMLSPGNRTMDELMRDMGYACDCARAALYKMEPK